MRFRSLNATFGKLERRTLDFGEGLTIIEAPNEAGKSTLTAFLSAMLYGLPARERGALAEKNRYAPWSGSPMCGGLCIDGTALGDVTILRDTPRAGLPLGRFTALSSGTGEALPGLTASDCGETLLGVSRDVYERSAFIRQGSLFIDGDAGLERRILSLVSSDDAGCSYSEAAETLRKWQNQRRYNKSGRIPACEAELAAVREQLQSFTERQRELTDACAELARLNARRDELEREAEENHLYSRVQQAKKLADAQQAQSEAQARVDALSALLASDAQPDNETISRLRGALVNLETAQRTLTAARAEQDRAAEVLRQAESAMMESPCTGKYFVARCSVCSSVGDTRGSSAVWHWTCTPKSSHTASQARSAIKR